MKARSAIAWAAPVCLVAALAAAANLSSGGQAAAAANVASIVPAPVSQTAGQGQFTLTSGTSITIDPASPGAAPGAQDLAGYLRPATGYQLPVVTSAPVTGGIALSLGNPGTIAGDPDGEGYQLTVASSGVSLEAPTPHGLFNGVQTLRQLLPVWISSPVVQHVAWTMPAVTISDYPRYVYRGLMLDIARHYEPPSAVEQLIDQAAALKINTFHLHLSDDQGFRLVINGFPNLSAIGGQGSVGTGGRTMDPGGFWTQAQYQEVVAYAAARYITLIPEVDTPGHDNAIIMSEYNDTSNPLLNGTPHDINCGANKPPVWDYTQDVGYSALCPASQNTWTILTAIINQIDAMTPGQYHDLGGDEVPKTLLSQKQYAAFVNKEAGIVKAAGKTVMGWADIAGRGTTLTAPSVAEYWQPASGSQPGTVTATEAVQKGMRLVMAPADHAYLDQMYLSGSAGNVPPTLGQNWACPNGCDVDQFYNWNPGTLVTGVTDKNINGVEATLFGETVVTLNDIDYMVFPRLAATAEVSWSPSADRSSVTSPAYLDFVQRLAAQGGAMMAAGTNFYPSKEVPWRLDIAPDTVTPASQGQVNGTLATVAAPGFAPAALTAAVDWGDGTKTAGSVTGTAPGSTTVNSLYQIGGQHTYAAPGTYTGTVTVTASGTSTVTAQFTVTVT
jgi:hexosaminidase